MTAASILAQIDTAIAARMAGNAIQNYTLPDGRSIRYYDLTQLKELRDYYADLAGEEAATTSSGTRNYAQFGRPR